MEPRFGLGLHPSDFHSDRIVPRAGAHHLPTGYRRPWAVAREAVNELAHDQKILHFTKEGFQACVDVHHFQPNEITVKAVDNTVVIEGKHEERDDGHGSVERHFIRKYVLPKEYDINAVHSSLSSDGVLTVKAPKPVSPESKSERHIPISHTAMPAHMSIENRPPWKA